MTGKMPVTRLCQSSNGSMRGDFSRHVNNDLHYGLLSRYEMLSQSFHIGLFTVNHHKRSPSKFFPLLILKGRKHSFINFLVVSPDSFYGTRR